MCICLIIFTPLLLSYPTPFLNSLNSSHLIASWDRVSENSREVKRPRGWESMFSGGNTGGCWEVMQERSKHKLLPLHNVASEQFCC
jgi:hypothetical protein